MINKLSIVMSVKAYMNIDGLTPGALYGYLFAEKRPMDVKTFRKMFSGDVEHCSNRSIQSFIISVKDALEERGSDKKSVNEFMDSIFLKSGLRSDGSSDDSSDELIPARVANYDYWNGYVTGFRLTGQNVKYTQKYLKQIFKEEDRLLTSMSLLMKNGDAEVNIEALNMWLESGFLSHFLGDSFDSSIETDLSSEYELNRVTNYVREVFNEAFISCFLFMEAVFLMDRLAQNKLVNLNGFEVNFLPMMKNGKRFNPIKVITNDWIQRRGLSVDKIALMLPGDDADDVKIRKIKRWRTGRNLDDLNGDLLLWVSKVISAELSSEMTYMETMKFEMAVFMQRFLLKLDKTQATSDDEVCKYFKHFERHFNNIQLEKEIFL